MRLTWGAGFFGDQVQPVVGQLSQFFSMSTAKG